MLEVTVKIEGFDEDGNADPDIQSEVVEKVSALIARQIEHKVREDVEKHFRDTIAERLKENVESFLRKPFQPTNVYGEKKGEPVTLIEFIAKAGADYLNEEVSERSGDYNSPKYKRAALLARKMADEHLSKELAPILEKAKTEAKNFISTKVATALREAMASAIK